jgi:tetratricopeptide (TPR) repeat protein
MSRIPPKSLTEMERAEEKYKKKLEMEEKLGDKEGMASDYGYLGTIYQTRSELKQTEIMYKKALRLIRSWAVSRVWQRYMANLVKFTTPVVIWIKPKTCLKRV